MSTKDYTSIPYSGYGSQGLQVFTPKRVEAVGAGGTMDVTKVVAIRISADNTYTLNGAGTLGTMPAGCTGIADSITSITFTDATNVEVM